MICPASYQIRVIPALAGLLLTGHFWLSPPLAAEPLSSTSAVTDEELQVDVMKKGLGKEVSIKKGTKEWYMLVEVTPDNTVVIRQEKDNDNYLVDESETHDRALTGGEVDTVIDDFINSVKTRAKRK
jgi:hypothetical protein